MKMTQIESIVVGHNSQDVTSGSSTVNSDVGSTSSSNALIKSKCTISSGKSHDSKYNNSKIPSPKPSSGDNHHHHHNHLHYQHLHKNNQKLTNNKLKSSTNNASKVKAIRFYRNGDIHQEEQLVSLDLTAFHDWNECLEEINRAVSYPGTIQVLFTVKGKKVSCVTELEKETDVVVSGKSPFRLLSYGPSMHSLYKSNKSTPQWRPNSARRAGRQAFTKSVILEPTVGDIVDGEEIPLQKTFSEHNVSSSGNSRKASPLVDGAELRNAAGRNHLLGKGRPVSCYSPSPVMATKNLAQISVSDEKPKKNNANCISKIPKRILHTNNNAGNGSVSPIMSVSTPSPNNITPATQSPARVMHRSLNVVNSTKTVRATSKERASKLDSAKKEFIRPRRVKIIVKGTKPRKASRFLLNKKTAVAFDQVLSAITESIKPEWGAVRKVFTLDGNEVNILEGFFGEEDIFLLCPNDRISPEDLELDPEECKVLKVPFEASNRRKAKSKASQRPRRDSEHLTSGQPSSRLPPTTYPTHPKHLPVSVYPVEVKEKFIIGDVIGDGNFAVVRLVTCKRNQEKFALKVIDKSKCNQDAPPDHEFTILSKVVHPNIILVFDKIDYNNELYVIMELIPSGDLFDHIAEATKFSEKESAGMTKDIISALSFLHSRRIVHRDIKAENLLVSIENGQRRIKLGDFGLAQEINGPLFTVCGTPTYVSPEILAETGYGRPVDIWAAGVIVYILLCGYPPFVSPTGEQEDLFDLILTGDFEFPSEQWDTISEDAKNLIVQMLEVDPDLRLDAESVLEHPWLASNLEEGKEKRDRLCRKDDFQFSVFEQMGLTKLQFPSSLYSNSNDRNAGGIEVDETSEEDEEY